MHDVFELGGARGNARVWCSLCREIAQRCDAEGLSFQRS